jgi:hypothetical protein
MAAKMPATRRHSCVLADPRALIATRFYHGRGPPERAATLASMRAEEERDACRETEVRNLHVDVRCSAGRIYLSGSGDPDVRDGAEDDADVLHRG